MKQKRNWVRKLCLLLFSLLFIAVMLRWFEHNQVYHPDRMMTSTGAELGRPFQDVFFQTTDGVELNGWFFPAATNSPRALMAVLLCHGNAGNISHRLEMCQVLLATGVNVFVFDYRGYGRSHGRPSEEGTYRDALAAVQWLQTKGFSPRNILGFGESLGGGVGSELALRGTLERSAAWSCRVPLRVFQMSEPSCFPGSQCAGWPGSNMTLLPSCPS